MKQGQREGRDSVCLKLEQRLVVHKGSIKPEAGADVQNQ